MNIDYYENFSRELEAGLKKQASKSLRQFIDSFNDEADVQQWVWSFLPGLEKNRHSCIRHELFIELVYPVLKRGFLAGDVASTLWLGKLSQNIYQSQGLFVELGSLFERDFYQKAYELQPENPEARQLLLNSIMSWLAHCQHEWPDCILHGMGVANAEECEDIRQQANLALSLADEQNDQEYIQGFLDKLTQYQAGLVA